MTDFERRRHNDSALEDLNTLEVLAKTGDTVTIRLFSALRLMTRLRLERPDIWEEIKKFAAKN